MARAATAVAPKVVGWAKVPPPAPVPMMIPS